MIKILNNQQSRAADVATLKSANISSFELMERAARALYSAFRSSTTIQDESKFAIFCGMGNNGGDGLALARLLINDGKSVRVFILKHKEEGSADFERNLRVLKEITTCIFYLTGDNYSLEFLSNELLVDAIFGSGLNRAVDGFTKAIVEQINSSGNPVLSIDSPTGLFSGENSNNHQTAVIKAKHTFTIGAPTLSLFFPSNHQYTGSWSLVEIGLDKSFLEKVEAKYFLLKKRDIAAKLKSRSEFAHKGNFGHALIVAGSYGKIGAALLSTKACLRTGAGLVSAAVPRCGYAILQTAVPEAMLLPIESEKTLGVFDASTDFDATAVGPGIGTSEETAEMLRSLLQQCQKPMVLDADALNILSENKELLKLIPFNSILTPHPGEFERLVGKWENDFQRLSLLIEFAKNHGIYLILKGKFSTLACPDGKIYFNPTGNSGMATAGSGDVLTGMLCALLAQKYDPLWAGLISIYVHGMAGDLAADEKTEYAMLSGDIIDFIPEAYKKLLQVQASF